MLTLLKRTEVERRTQLSRSTLYRLIAAGQFPAPVKIGGAARWQEPVIERWIAARIPAEQGASDAA